jgi:hypothetical protein
MGRLAAFVALARRPAPRTFDAFASSHVGAALFKEASMMSFASHTRAAVVVAGLFIISAVDARAVGGRAAGRTDEGTTTVQVSGSGFDDLKGAIVHSRTPTATGMIQHATETVELYGDMRGRVLYHVTSVFDFVNGTLVNTGDQVYSGTIAGSAPVMIHDDQFQFNVNLITGAETGQVYLYNHITGPKVRCRLDIGGTGLNADGNPTFDYTGECTFRGQ